ncbi:Hypothetical predicted protein [Mytilus galloprovincialis]|uniref:C2H2-type domain-containing protein n=1 Tax=Mytilus galloprovincialis TaxID=29158 RepID=A0A8B6ERM1_MYTGA|nr:Hypothetical predicted protein [Mytilus galloprovincialis]
MSNTCPDCGSEFSRKDVMLRHQRNKHRISQPYPQINDAYPPPPPLITPSPERIIWCYKRWQPLFSEMQQTIKNILFVQGLPENLNDDSFIDSRFPSLIILDDLMRDVTNSKDGV